MTRSYPLYLPLTQDWAESLTDIPIEPTNAQCAALLTLAALPQLAERAQPLRELAERTLMSLLEQAVNHELDLLGACQSAELLTLVQQAMPYFSEAQIGWLKPRAIDAKDYLTPDGLWDASFAQRQQTKLSPLHEPIPNLIAQGRVTSEQQHILQTLRNECDESLHVQGYAGSGKTHLIQHLAQLLPSTSTLLLAQSVGQAQALRQRLNNPALRVMTFGEFSDWLLHQDLTQPQHRVGDRQRLSHAPADGHIAQQMGIMPLAFYSPNEVISLCRQVIWNFCHSASTAFEATHLPRHAKLNSTEQHVLLEYSQRLWQYTLYPPSPELQPAIRIYHRVKHLSLLPNLALPEQITHVIIDESHDISAPLLQFLERGSQAIITLGDDYQRLKGQVPHRAATIRQRSIGQSIRTGVALEGVLNPLLEAHPRAPSIAFAGSRHLPTRVRYYSGLQIPDRPTALLVSREWGQLEWFQRLIHAGRPVSIMASGLASFRQFVGECIALFQDGTPTRHPQLLGCQSWGDLEQRMGQTRVFQRIADMLSRGYSYASFEAALDQCAQNNPEHSWQIGSVFDARNHEFNAVMLTPELFSPVASNNSRAMAERLSLLYTASSRVRYELWVPSFMEDWLKDHLAKRVNA